MGILYLHVGLHKTGTTTLQNQVFPCVENLMYLRRDLSVKPDNLYERIARFCFREKEDRSLLQQIRNELRILVSESDVLLSEEWFTSDYSPFSGYMSGAPWQERLTRLAKIVLDLRVEMLLSIRDPRTALFSYYCEMRQVGIEKQWPSFKDYLCHANDAQCFDVSYLEGFIRDLFSLEGVTILKFEHLRNAPGLFLEKALLFFNHPCPFELTIMDSNLKRKEGKQVFLRRRTWFELQLRRLGYRIPQYLKPQCLRNSWRLLLKRMKRYRREAVVEAPSNEVLALIEDRYAVTIHDFYVSE